MPTVDLFIMALERCPLTGMNLKRPVQVKFGYAQWDTKTVYEYTKELQVSAIDTIAASLAGSLEKEIRHALAGVLRQVQIEALERGKPKPLKLREEAEYDPEKGEEPWRELEQDSNRRP